MGTLRRALLLVLAVAVTTGSGFGVVGDSVGVQVRDELGARGAVVVARSGTDIPAGRPAIRRLARARQRPLVVELGLVDVGYWTRPELVRVRLLRAMRDDLAAARCAVWVDLPTWSPYELWHERTTTFNRTLSELAARHGVHVARWSRYAAGHPGWFWPDGFHLTQRGQHAFTRFLRDQVARHC